MRQCIISCSQLILSYTMPFSEGFRWSANHCTDRHHGRGFWHMLRLQKRRQGKVQIATLTRPILGAAISPLAPPPPLEIQVSTNIADPIAFPSLLPVFPLLATIAPLCEAQVHRCAIWASPTIPLDPFMGVRLPRVGARRRR